jgi:hypothetical protein
MPDRETIALTWVLGIGLSALLSSWLLLNPNVQNWSERRIALTSLAVSFALVWTALRVVRLVWS